MPGEMSDLIARLEAAGAGSRDLDMEIGSLVLPGRRGWSGLNADIPLIDGRRVPDYTTSLDAALSLVPDGAGIQINRYWIKSRDAGVWSAQISLGIAGHRTGSEDAPTAALALCIAALRARAPAPGSAAP